MFRNARHFLAPAAIACVTGLLLVLQLKTHARVQQVKKEMRVSEEMVAQLLQATDSRDQLLEELTRLREAAAQHVPVLQLEEELTLNLAAAGLMEVRGPGVTVVMADVRGESGPTRQVNAADVLTVLNELRAGGAEAIAVNGIRVTPRLFLSQSRFGERIITVNGDPVGEIIRIQAVGDPQLLTSSLLMRGGVVDQLSQWIYIRVDEGEELVIPPAAETPVYFYARPSR